MDNIKCTMCNLIETHKKTNTFNVIKETDTVLIYIDATFPHNDMKINVIPKNHVNAEEMREIVGENTFANGAYLDIWTILREANHDLFRELYSEIEWAKEELKRKGINNPQCYIPDKCRTDKNEHLYFSISRV